MTLNKNFFGPPRPTHEDYLRAFGYFAFMAWAVVFYIFPPVAFTTGLDPVTRTLWMAFTFVGAATAFWGSVKRIDIKAELPGIMTLLLGPVFYFVSQLYYSVQPPSILIPDPSQRYALVIYGIIPGILLLPRLYALFVEARRLKRINASSVESARQLLEAQTVKKTEGTRR